MKKLLGILFLIVFYASTFAQYTSDDIYVLKTCLANEKVIPHLKKVMIDNEQFIIIEDNLKIYFKNEESENGKLLLMTIEEMFFMNITDYIQVVNIEIKGENALVKIICFPEKVGFSFSLARTSDVWEIVEIVN